MVQSTPMDYSAMFRVLLEKRGLSSDAEIDSFLAPNYGRDVFPASLLPNMERAVARLLLAIERQERIAVYADFDCDGIPGAVIMRDTLAKVGHENIEVYIPHRDREGYGFHASAVEELAARGAGLIVTVDVGASAREAARRARALGVDVIVTDHHELPDALPDVAALVHPRLVAEAAAYPHGDLCGAAVAWKLSCALLEEGRKRGLARFTAVPEGWEKWLLDMVALATIADLVPLTGENRALVHYGLTVFRKSPRPGVRALCAEARVRQSEVTEDDIGYSIAPRINAASRMDEPELAFRILSTRDAREADALAARLGELNASRKGSVASIVREARRRARARYGGGEQIVVLGDSAWKPALLGLAAGTLLEDGRRISARSAGHAEEQWAGRRVVCMWGRDARGNLKGSCRSDGSVSVVELFSRASGALVEYGGHARSGGFSVSHEEVHALPEVFARAAEEAAQAAQAADAALSAADSDTLEVRLGDVSAALFSELSRLAPFGIGNPKPVFNIRGALVEEVRRFGREKNHTEVVLSCSDTGARCRAFQFFKSPADFSVEPVPRTRVSLFGTIERDSYRGGVAVRIVDMYPLS
ncbi:single-stranded-DNA-specific exonuclease RecJ [Candidatus Kaiserbacteria bacterium CG10_big_fil_rev_8_21_14_0_10_59_10]|uniref:Single-stranded-DNA-specific exonuclease RecJ n=1 Tax=Candidatus Kaiserbacteria bacterium CG10_big_fil_rev_8_21_14_0_10_59_10 TaxID=1974612 RepID=A0A2H0UAE0_9BACT|nr:MAG: single-stranded-DNA-specific exonuclease RecJ [Candidatus Kaiserbacteria bacterium CG10_big_fil_rev_8_21_14_0_10_59_10]